MKLSSVLKSWGIKYDEMLDIFECTEEQDPGKTWLIDRFESVIEDYEAFSKVDVHYGKVSEGDIPLATYLAEEEKFITVIRSMWEVNAGHIGFSIRPFAKPLLTSDENVVVSSMLDRAISEDVCVQFSNIAELELFARLTLREMADGLLVFPDTEALLRLDGMYIVGYFRDEANFARVQKAVSQAGLFLRRLDADCF